MVDDLTKWVKTEQDRIEKERRDFMKKHDMKDFFQAPKGESQVVLLPKVPRAVKGDYGTRQAFRVSVDSVERDWTVNPRSPIYRELVERIGEAPVGFTLIRTGEAKSTRYDIVWATK